MTCQMIHYIIVKVFPSIGLQAFTLNVLDMGFHSFYCPKLTVTWMVFQNIALEDLHYMKMFPIQAAKLLCMLN